MSHKYDAVFTNPPYMVLSNSSTKLYDYVKDKYPCSKTDLFAVFIERCRHLLKPNRFQAMITMHAWMFLSSYESLRKKLLLNSTIVNLNHLGMRAFDNDVGTIVQTVAFVTLSNSITNYTSSFVSLLNENSPMEKEIVFKNYADGINTCIKRKQSTFSLLPGSLYSYWASDNIIAAFQHSR